jgi:hypothetical protein
VENCPLTIYKSWLYFASAAPPYAYISARYTLWLNVVVWFIENSMFSIVTAAGMASMKAARSVFGWDMAYIVGSGWFVGCRALVSVVISTTVGCVGGRDSCGGPSVISVSLEGAGGSRWVNLVFGAIILRKCGSTKKRRKNEVDLLAFK